MMNQQPDKFFHEKLEGYQKPVPAAAWEKISATQPKKNKTLWLKIAASLLVLITASYVLWPESEKIEPTQSRLSENVKEQPQKNADLKTTEDDQDLKVSVDQEQPIEPEKRPEAKRVVKNAEAQPINLVNNITQEETITPDSIQETLNAYSLADVEPLVSEKSFSPGQASPSMTLVYTVSEVNEYLNKKALFEATSEDKKPSTFKKLLKKANDLKTNQDAFGDLRQKKNEILALNFKNEKERGQNK